MVRYKQLCFSCKKNYVKVTARQRYIVCYDCQKPELEGEIKDPKFKKLLDIPEEFYKDNLFLRNIKISYLKWGELTDTQINAFEKAVSTMREEGW